MIANVSHRTFALRNMVNWSLRAFRIIGIPISICAAILISEAAAQAPSIAPEPPRKVIVTARGPDATPQAVGTKETLDASKAVDAEEARNLLMQQLLRAAEAGIVTMQPQTPEETDATPPEATPEQDPAIEETAQAYDATEPVSEADAPDRVDVESPQPDAATAPSVEGNLAAHVTVRQPPDLERPAEQTEATATHDAGETKTKVVHPPRCFSRAQLKLPDILPGAGLAAVIGEQRKALIGEFDAANPEPAIGLAKTYLAVGMLQEARSVIREFAPDDPEGQFLLDIATTWVGDSLETTGSLFKDECIGIQALWRAYAQARSGELDAALKSEISSGAALEELPLHPRQVIASELGLAAASRGQWESARRLEAMARRAADGAQEVLGKTHLLSFRLATWRDDDDSAKKHLALASSSDVDTATEALLIRAEEALRSEDVLDASQTALRMDLGNLARREIGSDVARRAFKLEARLFHRYAGAEDTIGFLSDAVSLGLLDPDEHSRFLSDLISKPAYSDVTRPLAHIYLEDPTRFDSALEQKALRRSVIRSLAQQGIPGIAKSLVREGDLADADLASDLATSFLDVGAYRDAIAAISKADTGVRQQMVLSRAFLAMGDFEKAIGALDDIPARPELSSEEREAVAALRLNAELAGRDFASALSTSVEELGEAPSADLAAQSALIALEAGADEIPEAARKILAKENTADLENLEKLYPLGGTQALAEINSVSELDAILQEFESSEKAILEVLEDG